VLEATGHYGRNLCGFLAEQGFAPSVVNPLRARRFAQGDLGRASTVVSAHSRYDMRMRNRLRMKRSLLSPTDTDDSGTASPAARP
jgi:transposase